MAVLSLAFLLVGFALTSADKVSVALIIRRTVIIIIILNIKHVRAACAPPRAKAALIPERKVRRDPPQQVSCCKGSPENVSFLFALARVSAHTAPSVKCMLTLHTRGLSLLRKTCEIEAFCVRRSALNRCSAAAAAAAAPPAPPAPAPAGHLTVMSPLDLHLTAPPLFFLLPFLQAGEVDREGKFSFTCENKLEMSVSVLRR